MKPAPAKARKKIDEGALAELYARLRAVLAHFAPQFAVTRDSDSEYHLISKGIVYRGRPMFFAAVRRATNSVSYHLMPLYCSHELEGKIPPELLKRKNGKSCLGFKSLSEGEAEALKALTEAGLKSFRQRGWV